MKNRQFIKYPKILYLEPSGINEEKTFYLFEKLDGSNCQISRIGWRIMPGIRSKFIHSRAWDRRTKGVKSWVSDFRNWALSNKSIYNLPEEIVVYGEWLHRKEEIEGITPIIYPEEMYDKFYLLDVVELEENGKIKKFFPYNYAIEFLKEKKVQEINQIPFIERRGLTITDIEKIVKDGLPNKLAIGQIEGVVLKNYDTNPPFMRKSVFIDYEERNFSQEEGKRFCTLARIKKVFGEITTMTGKEPTLENLIEETKKDIFVETGKRVVNNDYLREMVNDFLRRRKGLDKFID